MIFAHHEFDDQTDPFEAGIGFTVPLKSKQDDFIGREALIRRKEHPRHLMVGLDVQANEAVGHGDCIHVGRAQVGVVTSATRSPILGKNNRARSHRRHPCGDRHAGGGRQARRPAEAPAGHRRAVVAL